MLNFFKMNFFKKFLQDLIYLEWQTVLDQDQARHFVGPDLDLSCLQRLSADDTVR